MLNTFEQDEIFYFDKSIPSINEDKFTIDEMRSIFMGRCYTICPVKTQQLMSLKRFGLKKSQDIKGITN